MKHRKFFGTYRGVVLDNNGKNGMCKVFVPTVYPDIYKDTPEQLPWCETALPFFGGSFNSSGNVTNKKTGQFMWPKVKAIVWVFFEGGSHLHPVMVASCAGEMNWDSETNEQFVYSTDFVKVIIDDNPLKTKLSNNKQPSSTSERQFKTDIPVALDPMPTLGSLPTETIITIENKNKIGGGAVHLNIIGNVSVNITGNLFYNVTGDVHRTINGNYYDHITGNHIEEVGLNRNTLILGNRITNIMMNEATSIKENSILSIFKNQTTFVTENKIESVIGATSSTFVGPRTIVGNYTETTAGNSIKSILGNSTNTNAGMVMTSIVGNMIMNIAGNSASSCLGEEISSTGGNRIVSIIKNYVEFVGGGKSSNRPW